MLASTYYPQALLTCGSESIFYWVTAYVPTLIDIGFATYSINNLYRVEVVVIGVGPWPREVEYFCPLSVIFNSVWRYKAR